MRSVYNPPATTDSTSAGSNSPYYQNGIGIGGGGITGLFELIETNTNNGGNGIGNLGGPYYGSGGGGGAGAVGVNGTSIVGGNGGVGLANSISGTSVFYAGGNKFQIEYEVASVSFDYRGCAPNS